MQEIESIELNNIQSHKSTIFELKKGKCISISGENRDDDLSDANGSGKSTLLEPLHICFIGSTSSGKSVKELVTFGESSGYCVVNLIDDNKNKTKIRVDLHKKKSTKVSIWENDEFRSDLHDLKPTESFKYIQDEILGITKQDLLDFYLITSESKSTFLSSTTSQKEKVVSRFSEADEINSWIDNTKKNIKKLTDEKINLEKKVAISHSNKDNFQARISEIEEKILSEDDNESKIQKGLSYINKNEKKLEDLYIQKDKMSLRLSDLEGEYSDLSNSINEVKSSLSKSSEKIYKTKSDIQRGESLLKDHHTCPKCSTKFKNEKEIDFNKVNSALNKIKEDLSIEEKILNNLKTTEKEYSPRVNAITREISTAKNTINSIDREIKSTNSIISESKNRLTGLKAKNSITESLREDIKKYESLLSNEDKTLQSLNKELKTVNSKIALYEFWKSEYSLFKNFLNQNTIKTIENKINEVLRRISNYEISVSGTKVLSTGKEKEELNITIDGRDYSTFSGGEKGRIDMASFIAFRDLINSKSKRGLSFISLDETLDRIDKSGIYTITKKLDYLGITSAIISHVQNVNENSVVVKKEGGLSTLQL